MPLAKVVCFPSIIAAMLTEIQLFHGISIKSILHHKTSITDRLGISRAEQVNITSELLLKLSYYVAIKRLHFMVIGMVKSR